MADILISAAIKNQGVTPADTGRVPVAQNDPDGPVRSTNRETTSFQRLTPAEKSSMETLGEMRQKGDALARVYEALKEVKKPGEGVNLEKALNAVQVPRKPESVGEALIEINKANGSEVNQSESVAVPTNVGITKTEEFGPDEALRTLELKSEARELEQAIIKVSQLGEESNGSSGGVPGANLQSFVSALSNMRSAAQNPEANQELARRTREDVVQNAAIAVQSFKAISNDLVKATLQ